MRVRGNPGFPGKMSKLFRIHLFFCPFMLSFGCCHGDYQLSLSLTVCHLLWRLYNNKVSDLLEVTSVAVLVLAGFNWPFLEKELLTVGLPSLKYKWSSGGAETYPGTGA